MRRAPPLALLLCALAPCFDAVASHLRSKPAEGKPVEGAVPMQPVKVPLVHTVLAKSSSQAILNKSTAAKSSSDIVANASLVANATADSNGTAGYPFRLSSYQPAIGKVFALYYSTMSGQKVTQIEARGYTALSAPPSDPVVFDPVTGASLARGNCKLRLKSHTTVMSDTRKYNLRMAEVAVCEQFFGSPCGGEKDGSPAKGCEIEMFAPLPYSGDQEKYIGAGMALTAHSLLCAERTEVWRRDSCALVRNEAAIAAGLQQSGSGIKLRPIPGEWTDLKMDATYELGFSEAVFSSANKADYEESNHYQNKDDVLAYSRKPPEAAFCEDLSCLIAKFQRR